MATQIEVNRVVITTASNRGLRPKTIIKFVKNPEKQTQRLLRVAKKVLNKCLSEF